MTTHDFANLAKKAADAIDEAYLISLTQALVKIRSVYEPGRSSEKEAAEFILSELENLGLKPVREEAAPDRPNIIADWQGSSFDKTKHRTLMFEGHTDVVTEGNPETWSTPPFGGQIKDGKLYGRGSADMKGGIAAAMTALKAIKETAPDLTGRIRFGIVVDEEGLMLGIKHFINQGWADDVDGAIICEPEENELCLFQKGAMRVAVTFTGRMAHGAMPYAGSNPIKALGTFLEDVVKLERSEQTRLGEHPYLGYPWLTPTIIKAPPKGEAQHNVMPAQAYLALDIRTVPGQAHDVLLADLQTIARTITDETKGLQIDIDCFESRPWTQTPKDDPLVKALEASYPLVFKKVAVFGGVPGATDGTFLHAWANVPVVTVGPGDRNIPHQKNEFVRLDELIQSAKLYAAAAIYYFA